MPNEWDGHALHGLAAVSDGAACKERDIYATNQTSVDSSTSLHAEAGPDELNELSLITIS